jgi:hypothetical protein
LTIEKINKMIREGAEITKQQLIEWGKTFKEIVVGESESKTKEAKTKEENEEEDADDTAPDEEDADDEDADEENGADYGGGS